MQNVADVQEIEVSEAGGEVVADAGVAETGLLDAGPADRAVADARLADMPMAVLAVVMRPSAGSAVTSDRRRRDVCNVSPS
jgi:hypothetical protein